MSSVYLKGEPYSKSQQIGNGYWLLLKLKDTGFTRIYGHETNIWSTKKEDLVNGPNLPTTFIDIEEQFCSCSINATHVAFAFLDEFRIDGHSFVHLWLLNFYKNVWISIGAIQYKDLFLKECNIALLFDKFYNRWCHLRIPYCRVCNSDTLTLQQSISPSTIGRSIFSTAVVYWDVDCCAKTKYFGSLDQSFSAFSPTFTNRWADRFWI